MSTIHSTVNPPQLAKLIGSAGFVLRPKFFGKRGEVNDDDIEKDD